MKKIAILGATGYIGKSLVYNLSLKKEFQVFLFARSTKRLSFFLRSVGQEHSFKTCSFVEFGRYKYDVVINCVGIGNPSDMKKAGGRIFEITEKFDNLVLKYLKNNPKTLYINLSSGAVYGKRIEKPIKSKSYLALNINHLDQGDYYLVAKVNSEAKHRSLSYFNIVDLRVFSFFSRFLELKPGYLIADAINAIKSKTVLVVTPEDLVRDYISPSDLLNLIRLIIKKEKINDVFDVYSAGPISKFALLKYLGNKYGLEYRMKTDANLYSPTGLKNVYYSTNKKAKIVGYSPNLSSLQGIEREIKNIIS